MVVRRERTQLALLLALAGVWIGLAIRPLRIDDWYLESLLVFVALGFLIATRRRWPLSIAASWLVFVFFVLHLIGAHWAYSHVPIDWKSWGASRNHYDRVVHLAFGLCAFLPVREILVQVTTLRPRAGSVFAFALVATFSGFYEIIEWVSAEVAGGDLGATFVGAQGDDFDAPKDMALAMSGALDAWLFVSGLDRFGRARAGTGPLQR